MKRGTLFVIVAMAIASCGTGGSMADRRARLLEERIEVLEKKIEAFDEIAAFVAPIMEQQKMAAAQRAATEHDPDARFAVPVAGSPSEGPDDAAVTIVEAFDFACPYCAQVGPILDNLVDQSDGKVRIVFKHYVIHPVVRDAHIASCAADEQGKFKAFKDAFWTKGFLPYSESGGDPASLRMDNIIAIAKDVGVDIARMEAAMGGACKDRIDADMAELERFGVSGTPSFFVNGRHTMFSGPEAFAELIDKEIQEVIESGVAPGDYYRDVVLAKGESKFRSRTGGQ